MLLSFRKVKAIYLINPHKTSTRQQAGKEVGGKEKSASLPEAFASW